MPKNPAAKEENGLFFDIAPQISGQEFSSLPRHRGHLLAENHPLYRPVLGHQSEIVYLEIGPLTVSATPEAEAISGGGAFLRTGNQLRFRLPRYHLGVPAQMDMAVACYHLAQTPRLRDLIETSTPDNSGIIYFAREGHLTNWQAAVFLTAGQYLPTTIVNISHRSADNSFTRRAYLASEPNLEGFPRKNLETLYIGDPIASGMQYVEILTHLDRRHLLPRTVVAIAPMATAYGLAIIDSACRRLGTEFQAGLCAALLDIRPDRYYSPYPESVNAVTDPLVHGFINRHFGDEIHNSCIRGDWSGTLLGGKKYSLAASRRELAAIGSGNRRLLSLCRRITPEIARKEGVFDKLLPYSTRLSLI